MTIRTRLGKMLMGRSSHIRFLSAQFLSSFGDRMSFVVLPFALLSVGMSPSSIAVVIGARAAGFVVVVFWGGLIADRVSPAFILRLSDWLRCLIQVAVAVLFVNSVQSLWPYALLMLSFGVFEGLFKPAALVTVPAIAESDQLTKLNGNLNVLLNLGMLIGPVVGGVMISQEAYLTAFLIDAGTFLLSGLLLGSMKLKLKPEKRPTRSPKELLTDSLAGLHMLRSMPWLWKLTLADGFVHLLALSAAFSLGPILVSSWQNGGVLWGVIVSSFGLGGTLGGIMVGKLKLARPGFFLIASLGCIAAQPLFLASGMPFGVIAILQFLAGISLSFFSVVSVTLTQALVPTAFLGRVSSFDLLFTSALLPLGYWFCSLATGYAHVETVMLTFGAASLLAASLLWLSKDIREVQIKPQSHPSTQPLPAS